MSNNFGIVTSRIQRKGSGQPTTIDGLPVTTSKGNTWYVDASRSGTGTGKSWQAAFLTMQEAFNKVGSGDTIRFVGKVLEQLVTPVQVFDVKVIGMGARPRHADSTPSGGNTHASQWGPPASGAVSGQATVRVLQQGWVFQNILFTMESATAAAIELVRNAGAGNAERDASHAQVLDCRFAGAGIGIRSGVAGSFTEIVFNVLVEGNTFQDNTIAMSGINGNQWVINRNLFRGCTDAVKMPSVTGFDISYNIFNKITTGVILLTGGSDNSVHYNALPGTYTTGANYAEGTSDNWNGNAASTGFTAAVP